MADPQFSQLGTKPISLQNQGLKTKFLMTTSQKKEGDKIARPKVLVFSHW